MEYFLHNLLSPILIVIFGKYIDAKVERYRAKRDKEKAQELAKEQEIRATIDLVSVGIMSVLRDRILQSCNYYIGKGAISALALENITRMHDSYKALGGNGLCDHQYDAIQNLPLEE